MTIVWACLAMAIILDYKVRMVMTLSDDTRSSVKKFWVFFTWIITFLYFIDIIAMELSWYIILVSGNWPSEFGFESHLRAKTILCNLILLPSIYKIETVPISSIWITYSMVVIKSIHFVLILLNSFWLLQKW